MLQTFKCRNFKGFRDGFVFNMIPEGRMLELNYSIIREKTGRKEAKGLSTSVIYGPNAAGKSSVIHAMSCFRQIVLRGDIRDEEEDRTGDHVSSKLSLAPFAFEKTERPVSFDIIFIFHGNKYQYGISIFLGAFLDETKQRYIEEEKLYVNDELIFHRTKDEIKELQTKSITKFLNYGFKNSENDNIRKMMSQNISEDSLLLLTDFNSFCSKKIVNEIREWFEKYFIVVNSSDRTRFFPRLPEKEGSATVNRKINHILREAGIFGHELAYYIDPKDHTTKLLSVLRRNGDMISGIEAEKIESIGTIRLATTMMPIMLYALKVGATLIMDEGDASLHPMMMMNFISIFHNNEVNRSGAQFIFNTQNPIYLNHNLLRRDEIKFVEKDDETKASELYALSDFKANGEASVRKTSDYMRNYFLSRYGAIVDIDFTDIITEILYGDESDG